MKIVSVWKSTYNQFFIEFESSNPFSNNHVIISEDSFVKIIESSDFTYDSRHFDEYSETLIIDVWKPNLTN